MPWSLLQKCYSIVGLTPSPPNLTLFSKKKSKIVATSHTNPEISFNFKT